MYCVVVWRVVMRVIVLQPSTACSTALSTAILQPFYSHSTQPFYSSLYSMELTHLPPSTITLPPPSAFTVQFGAVKAVIGCGAGGGYTAEGKTSRDRPPQHLIGPLPRRLLYR